MEAALTDLRRQKKSTDAQTTAVAAVVRLLRSESEAAAALELDGVDTLITVLQNGNPAARAAAALGICRIQADPEAPAEILAARGRPLPAVEALLHVASGGPSGRTAAGLPDTPEGRGNAAAALTELVRATDDAAAQIMSAGGVATLLGIVGTDERTSPAAREAAVWTLRTMLKVVGAPVLTAMHDAGGGAALTAMVQDSTGTARAAAIGTLTALMEGIEGAAAAVAEAGGSAVLLAALKDVGPKERGGVALALARLMEGAPGEAATLFDGGIVDPLLALLKESRTSVAAGEAALALSRVQNSSPLVSMALVDAKADRLLRNLVKDGADTQIKQRAAVSHSFLCELDSEFADDAVAAGSVNVLCAGLADARKSAREDCINSLQRMLLVSPEATAKAIWAVNGQRALEAASADKDVKVAAAARAALSMC